MKPRYYIQTFGCQMNVHDSERMAGMLEDLGYEPTTEVAGADVLLMNTCAVRERPEHKLYSELGELRKLKQHNPDMVIGVAGCMAQREADGIVAASQKSIFCWGHAICIICRTCCAKPNGASTTTSTRLSTRARFAMVPLAMASTWNATRHRSLLCAVAAQLRRMSM
jgi:hypothetical protein